MPRVLAPALIGIWLTFDGGGAIAQPAEDFVARSGMALQEIAAAAPGAALRAACGSHAEASFDLPALAQAIAGVEIWNRLGDSRRPTFRAALRARLIAECARGRRGGTLTLLASRPSPSGLSVTARMALPDGAERILVWRLRAGGPWGWQATDLVADGISLAAALRDEVRAAYDAANGDVEAAIMSLSRGAPLT